MNISNGMSPAYPMGQLNGTVQSGSVQGNQSVNNGGNSMPKNNSDTDIFTNKKKMNNSIDSMNKQLVSVGKKVVIAPNKPANEVWLNIVDSSGRVLQEIPPDGVRRLIESAHSKGLSVDMFL